MAYTVSFAVGTSCAGAQHIPITATRVETPTQNLTITVTKAQATAALTVQERADFLTLLVRMLLSQGSSATNAQLKTALQSKVVDLTLPGF
jgi:hypothetical protein